LLAASSANQTAPSGPCVMPIGCEPGVGMAYSPPQLAGDGACKPMEVLHHSRARPFAGEAAAHGRKLDLDVVEVIAWQRHSVAGRGPLPWHICYGPSKAQTSSGSARGPGCESLTSSASRS
jgi:hypothetical protein